MAGYNLPDIPDEQWISDQQDLFDQGAKDLEDSSAFMEGTYGTLPDIGRYAPVFEKPKDQSPPERDRNWQEQGSGEFSDQFPFLLGPNGPESLPQGGSVPNEGMQYPEEILNPQDIQNDPNKSGYVVAQAQDMPPVNTLDDFNKFTGGLIDNIGNMMQPPTAMAAEGETPEQTAQRHMQEAEAPINPDLGAHELPPPDLSMTTSTPPELTETTPERQRRLRLERESGAAQQRSDDAAIRAMGPQIPASDPRQTSEQNVAEAGGFGVNNATRTDVWNKLQTPVFGGLADAGGADIEYEQRQHPEVYGQPESRHQSLVETRPAIFAILEPLSAEERITKVAQLREAGLIDDNVEVPLLFDRSRYYVPIQAKDSGIDETDLRAMAKYGSSILPVLLNSNKSPEDRAIALSARQQAPETRALQPEDTPSPFTPYSEDPTKAFKERQQYGEANIPEGDREAIQTAIGIGEGVASGAAGKALESSSGITRAIGRGVEAITDPLSAGTRAVGPIREAFGTIQNGMEEASRAERYVVPHEIATRMPQDPGAATTVDRTLASKIANVTNDNIGLDVMTPNNDGSVDVHLSRFQNTGQHAYDADLRGSVFYTPYGRETYKRTADTHGEGGSEAISGLTRFNNPLYIEDPSNGFVGRAAVQELLGPKQVSNLVTTSNDLYRDVQDMMRNGEPRLAQVEKVKEYLTTMGGDPASAESVLDGGIKHGNFNFAVPENVAAQTARNRGYDSIIGHSGGNSPLVTEIMDLRESNYPGPKPHEFGVRSEFLPPELTVEGETKSPGYRILNRAGIDAQDIDRSAPNPNAPHYQPYPQVDFNQAGNAGNVVNTGSFVPYKPEDTVTSNEITQVKNNIDSYMGSYAADIFSHRMASYNTGGKSYPFNVLEDSLQYTLDKQKAAGHVTPEFLTKGVNSILADDHATDYVNYTQQKVAKDVAPSEVAAMAKYIKSKFGVDAENAFYQAIPIQGSKLDYNPAGIESALKTAHPDADLNVALQEIAKGGGKIDSGADLTVASKVDDLAQVPFDPNAGTSAVKPLIHYDSPVPMEVLTKMEDALIATVSPQAKAEFTGKLIDISKDHPPTINDLYQVLGEVDPGAKTGSVSMMLENAGHEFSWKYSPNHPFNNPVSSTLDNVKSIFRSPTSEADKQRFGTQGLIKGAVTGGEQEREREERHGEAPNPLMIGQAALLGAVTHDINSAVFRTKVRTVGGTVLHAIDEGLDSERAAEHLRGLGNIKAPTERAQSVIRDIQEVVRGKLDDVPEATWDNIMERAAAETGDTVDEIRQSWFDQFGKPNDEAVRGYVVQAAIETNAERIAQLTQLREKGEAPIDVENQLHELNSTQGILQLAMSNRSSEIGRALNAMKIGHASIADQATIYSLGNLKKTVSNLTGEIAKSDRAGKRLTSKGEGLLDDVELFYKQELNRPPDPNALPDVKGGATGKDPTPLEMLGRDYAARDQDLIAALRSRDSKQADSIRARQRDIADQIDAILRPQIEEDMQKVKKPLSPEEFSKQQAQKVIAERRKIIKNEIQGPARDEAEFDRLAKRAMDRKVAEDGLQKIERIRQAAAGSQEWRKCADELLTNLADVSGYTDIAVTKYRQRTAMNEFKKLVGSDTKITPEMAAGLYRQDFTDPRAIAKYVKYLTASTDPAFHVDELPVGKMQKLMTLRVASMLSGSALLTNAVGNEVMRAGRVADRAVAGTVEGVRTLGGTSGAMYAHPSDALAEIDGWMDGVKGALNEFGHTWDSGISARNVRDVHVRSSQQFKNPLLGGLNGVLRGMAAADDYSYALNMNMALTAEANREARVRGLSRKELMLHLEDYPQVFERASHRAARSNLADNLSEWGKGLNTLRSSNPVIGFLVPFFNTNSNIFKQGFTEYSPTAISAAHKAAKDGDLFKASDQAGYAALGTGLGVTGVVGGLTGNIRVLGPQNPAIRSQERERKNEMDYSVSVGGHNVSLLVLGPYAVPIVLGGLIGEAVRNEAIAPDKAADEWGAKMLAVSQHVVGGTASTALNMLGLRSLTDNIGLIGDVGAAPSAIATQGANMITTTIPYGGALGVLRRGIDMSARDTNGGIDYILNNLADQQGKTESVVPGDALSKAADKGLSTVVNRLPGLSKMLPEELTPTGESHATADPFIRTPEINAGPLHIPSTPVGLNPLSQLPAQEDPLYDVLKQHGVGMSNAPSKLGHPNLKGVDIDLTKQEQQLYQQEFGKKFREEASKDLAKYGDTLTKDQWDTLKEKVREIAAQKVFAQMSKEDSIKRSREALEKTKRKAAI